MVTCTVPDVSPIKSADGNLVDGRYEAGRWVRLDGWDHKVALKVGVLSKFEVKDGNHGTPARSTVIMKPHRTASHHFSSTLVM